MLSPSEQFELIRRLGREPNYQLSPVLAPSVECLRAKLTAEACPSEEVNAVVGFWGFFGEAIGELWAGILGVFGAGRDPSSVLENAAHSLLLAVGEKTGLYFPRTGATFFLLEDLGAFASREIPSPLQNELVNYGEQYLVGFSGRSRSDMIVESIARSTAAFMAFFAELDATAKNRARITPRRLRTLAAQCYVNAYRLLTASVEALILSRVSHDGGDK